MSLGTLRIPLTKGKYALIDAEDYDLVGRHKWYAAKFGKGGFYAARRSCTEGKDRTILMHREVLGLKTGDRRTGDHINGDGLDNRRSNLRVATSSQNSANRTRLDTRNTSGYNGVSWHKRDRKWYARITVDGKVHRLGGFSNPEDAANAYNSHAKRLFGDFATKLNERG